MNYQVAIAVDAAAELGEGTLWDEREQVLWWVDILAHRLHRYDPVSAENRSFNVGSAIGTVALRASGGLVIANEDGIFAFDPQTATRTLLVNPEGDRPNNRMNDGKVGPNGSLYVGSMGYEAQAESGSLYQVNADRSWERIVPNVTISNGMAWNSAETRFYYIDSPTQQITAYDYDKTTGAIANRRVAVQIPQSSGAPDGMTIDSEGMLWVAHWGGSAVNRWNPHSGKHLATIQLPATQITNCAFGGANLDTLYITSARTGLSTSQLKKQPSAGSVYSVKLSVSGKPAYQFGG